MEIILEKVLKNLLGSPLHNIGRKYSDETFIKEHQTIL